MSAQPDLQGACTLLVEDDDRFRGQLARALRARGYDIREAATLEDARQALRDGRPSAVVLDLRLGEVWTLDFLDELHGARPDLHVVVLTGYGSIATAVDAVRHGAAQYLTKPVEVDQLVAALQRGAAATALPHDVRPMSLARLEWEHINRVLRECGGNVSEAARALGMHRRSLQRKLSKYPTPR